MLISCNLRGYLLVAKQTKIENPENLVVGAEQVTQVASWLLGIMSC